MENFEISPANHYAAALDSVNLINELVAKSDRNQDDNDTIARNIEHLEIMVAKDFWTDENLAPLHAAIATVKA
jgi:hypothetical protein